MSGSFTHLRLLTGGFIALVWAASSAVMAPAALAAPTCDGEEATIVGTSGPDHLVGTEERDVIVGGRGHDVIEGRGGDDLLCGNRRVDHVIGGPGQDHVRGGPRRDHLVGGPGNDLLVGSWGADVFAGDEGDDSMVGGRGDDFFGDGIRPWSDGTEPGDDVMDGGWGRDWFYAGEGNDRIDGGSGGEGDSYRGDALSYRQGRAVAAPVHVDLEAGTAVQSTTGSDLVSDIEQVLGTSHDDTILGDDDDNALHHYEGDDVIAGRGGNDAVPCLSGADAVDGGSGPWDRLDVCNVNRGDTRIDVPAGLITIYGLDGSEVATFEISGFEWFRGTSGEDHMVGNAEPNVFDTEDWATYSADQISGFGGDDILCGDDNDKVDGGEGQDACRAGTVVGCELAVVVEYCGPQ